MTIRPMQPEVKPHPWSCLATSFAMALGIKTSTFEYLAGHNGSRVVFENLPEPQRRRGFHISEAVHVTTLMNANATPFELMPQIASSDGLSTVLANYGDSHSDVWNWIIFGQLIACTRGVIECRTQKGNYHAVAYEKGRIFDPDGRIFDYTREGCESRGLFTTRLWRIEK